MRFQFCGMVACPEWFISEITVLTKITAVKMKLIFNQLIALYLDGDTPETIAAKISKLLTGTGLDIYEINAVISTLNFILQNSVQFHVTDLTLNKELIDLGLPKENVESITKGYKGARDKLLEKALEKIDKDSVELLYSVHDFVGSYRLPGIAPIRFAEVTLENNKNKEKKGKGVPSSFIMTQEDLDEVIYEMEEALSIVDRLQSK